MSDQSLDRIALFPLSSVLFPGEPLRLHLFEQRYRDLMRDRSHLDPIFGVVLTREGWEVGDQPAIHRIGTAATLEAAVRHDDGRYSIAVEGTRRFRVRSEDWSLGYLAGDVEWLPDRAGVNVQVEAGRAARALTRYAKELARSLGGELDDAEIAEVILEALSADEVERSWQIAARLPLNTWQLQELLEIDDTSERLTAITATLDRERRRLAIAGPAAGAFEHARASFSPN